MNAIISNTLFQFRHQKNIIIAALLLMIVLFGFSLRTIALPDNMLFGYEQGRDAIVARDILSGDFTLLGPKTDSEGIYHGVGIITGYLLFIF